MKAPWRSDQAFLDDVRAALAAGRCGLWWLGQSGFLVVRNGRALVFDPYLSDSLTRKYAGTDKPHVRLTGRVVDPAALGALGVIDVITSSHLHTDHLDAETLRPLLAANPQARLVLPAALRAAALERLGADLAGRLVELDDGVAATVVGVTLRGVAAAHNTVERDEAGRCRFLGYVAEWPGLSIYHSGDTLEHPGLVPALRPRPVDVALLPINGDRPERRVAGNLDGPQAARLARAIGARLAIPCHFDLFAFNTADPGPFLQACAAAGQPCRLLRQGEGLALDGANREGERR